MRLEVLTNPANPTSGPVAPIPAAPDRIAIATARLEAWLESMRCPGGYGGPVVHWWQQSLVYTGPGLDWRYEGIITGYLQLWQRTGNRRWLQKAIRAGDDLVAGQLADGHYAASCFEINPASAGTPHEAACDVGLLLLAQALKEMADHFQKTADGRPLPEDDRRQTADHFQKTADGGPLPEDRRRQTADHFQKTADSGQKTTDGGRRSAVGGQHYADCAQRNLEAFYIDKLWDADARSFRDSPMVPSFVPNKAATACEAFFLLAEVGEDESWIEQTILPNLDRIIEHQVRDGSRLDGAIAQNSFGPRHIEKYFPKYIARCVPALIQGYDWSGDGRYADCALDAMQFIARYVYDDGSLPTVVYDNGRVNRWPSWISPLADVLWAADTVRSLGFDSDLSAIQERLLAGQDESGGIQTATGFAAQAGGQPPDLPDVRDVLHVTGWCDKAFRYLASRVDGSLPEDGESGVFETDCTFQTKTMHYKETPVEIEITQDSGICYLWRKGESWPDVATEEFWLR